ncbi:MAG: hypothetical protein M1821_008701 [Bathelium mastoideum]|nr:MAG: hypothetical protein M1821_008701 [Bathelium mastoideum]
MSNVDRGSAIVPDPMDEPYAKKHCSLGKTGLTHFFRVDQKKWGDIRTKWFNTMMRDFPGWTVHVGTKNIEHKQRSHAIVAEELKKHNRAAFLRFQNGSKGAQKWLEHAILAVITIFSRWYKAQLELQEAKIGWPPATQATIPALPAERTYPNSGSSGQQTQEISGTTHIILFHYNQRSKKLQQAKNQPSLSDFLDNPGQIEVPFESNLKNLQVDRLLGWADEEVGSPDGQQHNLFFFIRRPEWKFLPLSQFIPHTQFRNSYSPSGDCVEVAYLLPFGVELEAGFAEFNRRKSMDIPEASISDPTVGAINDRQLPQVTQGEAASSLRRGEVSTKKKTRQLKIPDRTVSGLPADDEETKSDIVKLEEQEKQARTKTVLERAGKKKGKKSIETVEID